MHYHRNAKTNLNQREALKKSSQSGRKLAEKYEVSHVTCLKWKKRHDPDDRSSQPHTIHYAVDKGFWQIIKAVRKKTLLPLDDLLQALASYVPKLNRSNCYRILKYYRLNRLTLKDKHQSKKFSSYKPGYIHIDIFYLPRIEGKRYYCFLAIDRATRMVYLSLYPRRRKEEAADFLLKCLQFFPYRIHHILTDNGREFTMKGQSSFEGKATEGTYFEILCELAGITYRKTKAYHPWTNGMAERMVRTTKEHTTKLYHYQNMDKAVQDIKEFQDIHNYRRKLKALNFKTPYQITMEWFVKDPAIFITDPTDMLLTRL